MQKQFLSVASLLARGVGLGLLVGLVGCGQKGPLTLPAPLPPAAAASGAPQAAAPASKTITRRQAP